jgi:hypothetical protein
MSDYSISLNGIRCVSLRLVTCWKGTFFADCSLDSDSTPVTSADVPSGVVTVTLSSVDSGEQPITIIGTVDPNNSGRFVSTVPVRVVGGYGWLQKVPGQHFHSDSGVSSATVEKATAAAVGEKVVDPSPVLLGTDWVRVANEPASSVFQHRDWYVDTDGMTQVASRPTVPPDSSVELLSWDPLHQHGTLSGDALVLPGTVITDARFDGPITVRDVVQTWDHSGTRIEIWCGQTTNTKLMTAMQNMVRVLGGVSGLKRYRYRIVAQNGDGRLVLQAMQNPDGSKSDAPDLNPVAVAPGMSGLSALYKTSSECTVAFIGGDKSQPWVESFDAANLPTELTLDASNVVHVGPSATVKLAEKSAGYLGAPLARVGDAVSVLLPPLCPLSGALNGVPIPPGTLFLSVPFPLPGAIQTGAPSALG